MKKQTCTIDVNVPHDLTTDNRTDHYVRCKSTFIYDMTNGGLKMEYWIYGMGSDWNLKDNAAATEFMNSCKLKIEENTSIAAKIYYVRNYAEVVREFNEVQNSIRNVEVSGYTVDNIDDLIKDTQNE